MGKSLESIEEKHLESTMATSTRLGVGWGRTLKEEELDEDGHTQTHRHQGKEKSSEKRMTHEICED